MVELSLAYKVRSYSTGTPGRAICNARTHHFVADDSGGEEVGAGELFLSGITACAVNMLERVAKERNIEVTESLTETIADYQSLVRLTVLLSKTPK